MNNIKISVIIPIYNTEKYLEETLDSILNQTMIDDVEVLMIDDGSKDNSRKIIEKYASEYDNFYGFYNENVGQGCERNFGMEHARGEYIHFMDSDDYIPPKAYEKLYEIAKEEDYDIVMGNISKFTSNSTWNEHLYETVYKEVDEYISSTNIHQNKALVYDTSPTNKIIKRSFLEENQILFPDERIFYEDLFFTIKMHHFAKKVGILHEDVYYWRSRRDSSSTSQQVNQIGNFKDRINILNFIQDFLEKKNENEIIDAEHNKWLEHDLLRYINKDDPYTESDYEILFSEINKILDNTEENVKNNLNTHKRIIYKNIENNDIEHLRKFKEIDSDLKANPNIIRSLDADYEELDNFDDDAKAEDLVANLESIKINKDNKDLILKVEAYVPYLTDKNNSKIKFKIIETLNKSGISEYHLRKSLKNLNIENYDYVMDGNEDNSYEIVIPYEEQKKLDGTYNIFISYENENIKKEGLLKFRKPKKILNNGNMEIFAKFWLLRFFNLEINEKRDEEIHITNIKIITKGNNLNPSFNKILHIDLESNEKIDKLIIENLVTFKKMEYETNSISYDENNYKFSVDIPFKDILPFVIRKWELKSEDNIRVKIPKTFRYKDDKIKITMKNNKNRLFIESIYHKTEVEPKGNKNNGKSNKTKKIIRKLANFLRK